MSLSLHVRTMDSNQSQTKVQNFPCARCNIKPFSQKSHLTTHIKLKHGNDEIRKCILCDKTFAQMNKFVVHYKKNHINKKCSDCAPEELCEVCKVDLNESKIKWQLQIPEIRSQKFEPVAGHFCEICQIPFTQSSHLNTHNKLKHSSSGRGCCTKCPTSFAQMNNFAAHYKKKHVNKDCVCYSTGKL